jgi:hypothetical protein
VGLIAVVELAGFVLIVTLGVKEAVGVAPVAVAALSTLAAGAFVSFAYNALVAASFARLAGDDVEVRNGLIRRVIPASDIAAMHLALRHHQTMLSVLSLDSDLRIPVLVDRKGNELVRVLCGGQQGRLGPLGPITPSHTDRVTKVFAEALAVPVTVE